MLATKLATQGYAAKSAGTRLEPFQFDRREPGPHDVLIAIQYCGICHTDIHQVRNEWGTSVYPMVPGHEIVGSVVRVGEKVSRFKPGDTVGVGCFVDSCRTCPACKAGEEQFCEKGMVATYNSKDAEGNTTYGGYSSQIVVDENYVLKVSSKLPLERIAPLLCAGITTYSPLKRFGAGRGKKVAVAGLGGLGHMAVKLAAAMGSEVTVLSSTPSKKADAKTLGAHAFALTGEPKSLEPLWGRFDMVLDTVSAKHDLDLYLTLLRPDATLALVGAAPQAVEFRPHNLILGRKRVAGSLIGGIKETQEMLDFCAERNIGADVEVIPMKKVEEAYERALKSDVRYRFVINMKTL
ncbi:MAG TPA: NAD(P)-dependent alcohol dehydrogenase [bacterium]|nr:NAD(P)-dependent alcohol dehydrogenase [bacterium]